MVDPLLLNDVKENEEIYMADIADGVIDIWNDLPFSIRAHYGPLASGNQVIDSREKLKSIGIADRKTEGVEMEGFAVLFAARECNSESTKAIIIKAVCDFGCAKTDRYQELAAKFSAKYAYNFVTKTRLL